MFIISQFWGRCNIIHKKSEHFICFGSNFGSNVRDVPNNGPKEGAQGPKVDCFRTKTPSFRAIWRDLEKFGFWFGLNVSAYNPCYDWLSLLTQYFLKKVRKILKSGQKKFFLWSRCFDVQIIQNRFIPGFVTAFKKSKFQSKIVQFTNFDPFGVLLLFGNPER